MPSEQQDNAERGKTAADSASDETQQPPEVRLAKAVGSEGHSKCGKKKWYQNPNNWISAATLLFVGAYTLITLFIMLRQHADNLEATIEANRAWLDVSPKAGPLPDRRVVVDLYYVNTGKGPAQYLAWNVNADKIAISNPDEISKAVLPENKTCIGLAPDPKGSASFPFIENRDFRSIIPFHRAITKITLDEWFASGAIWVEGCLAYKTTDRTIGKTKFCSIMTTFDRGNTVMASDCPGGGIAVE